MTEHKEHALPDCWAWTKLGDIAEITLGQSPPSSDYNENGKGLPFYQGKTEFGKTYPTPKKWCNKPKKIAQKGDVLISVRAPVGPTNLSNEKSCIGRGLASIRGLCGIDSYYILHLLRRYEKEIAAKGTGTTFSAISGNQLRNLEIPLPPLNEQRRIINKVEVLFSYLDAGIASLRLVQAQLKRYRQAVLKAAFEGKLTQQWRIENIGKIDSAEKLLELIKREKINNPKYKELPSVNPAELPEIPASWSWTRLGELLFLSSERYNPNPSENLPFVGLENIEGGTGKLLGFGKSSETRSTKNRFKKGDLLYGKLRPYLNKVWVADFDGVCSTDILVFNKNSYINNNYLGTFLLNQDFVEYARQHMSGVQHPRISYQALSQYEIPLPPSAEQDEIADKIQQNFLIIERIESELQKFTKQSEVLRQSILKDAFMGKLVPQNPADEPPDKLLERIKAERLSNKSKNINQKELSQYVK